MLIIRPVKPGDFDALLNLNRLAGSGIYNLPKRPEPLQKKIEASLASFAKQASFPSDEKYLFVMEDLQTKELIGTSSIYATRDLPHPVYQIVKESNEASSLPIPLTHQLLYPSWQPEPSSELCALFLNPEKRKKGIGKLLSFSRLLFIGMNLSCFHSNVIAELRGVVEENASSPFWEGIGKHFLNLTYHQVVEMLEEERPLPPDILPRHPIYASLLSAATSQVIEKVHANSKPAFEMLVKQGFAPIGEIDAFDGGPTIMCKASEIAMIKNSKTATVKAKTSSEIQGEEYLVCSRSCDFRCTVSTLKIEENHLVTLPSETFDALQVTPGDRVCFAQF